MYYRMTYRIRIGNSLVRTIEGVRISRSVEALSDSASITLPAMRCNRMTDLPASVRAGVEVEIQLGYNDDLHTEFLGYLKAVRTDNGKYVLECEDNMYLWRTPIPDAEKKQISLRDLLKHLCTQVNAAHGTAYDIECDYQYTYDKFVFVSASAIEVLRKVQEETNANIWFDGTTLHVHPVYSRRGEQVVYDFAANIRSADLRYVKAEDKNLRVRVEKNNPDGTTQTQEYGKQGGTTVVRHIQGSNADMQTAAQNEYNLLCYDGYEGNLTGWLIPYCQPGDVAEIRDSTQPERNGHYYIIATDLTFDSQGTARKVTIGRKM
jgi:hypothetical protein